MGNSQSQGNTDTSSPNKTIQTLFRSEVIEHASTKYVVAGQIVGVGTGSTANFFIDELARIKDTIPGAVASSEAPAARLRSHGIKVFDLNDVVSMPVYIDGADEIDANGAMIKGGGAALTREKIVASVAEKFVCIADGSKLVNVLGKFPLPIEVIPMAQAVVARQLSLLGGEPKLRMKDGKPLLTDNGNVILDVHGLEITNPVALEAVMNNIVGVVTVGLFAKQGANVCLLGMADGVKTLTF